MNGRTLWNHIEARLDSQLPGWRTRLDELRQDESEEEQRETIEFLLRALDEDRLSDRKLFSEELKGKTW